MTTEELIAMYRLLADDGVVPYRVDDATIQTLLLEGEAEAAVRARLLTDTATIAVSPAKSLYAMPEEFYELAHVAFVNADGARYPLKLVSAEYLDQSAVPDPTRIYPPLGTGYPASAPVENWRDATGTAPIFAVQSDVSLRLVPIPLESGTLVLEGYRLPRRYPDEDPEISLAHHAYLVYWALYRTFSITDEDHFDQQRASIALGEFTQYFGIRPDADLRRTTRHDTPHHVEAFFV